MNVNKAVILGVTVAEASIKSLVERLHQTTHTHTHTHTCTVHVHLVQSEQ